jgi:hypothetical protein
MLRCNGWQSRPQRPRSLHAILMSASETAVIGCRAGDGSDRPDPAIHPIKIAIAENGKAAIALCGPSVSSCPNRKSPIRFDSIPKLAGLACSS